MKQIFIFGRAIVPDDLAEAPQLMGFEIDYHHRKVIVRLMRS